MSASETSLADTSHEAIPGASNGTARIIVRAYGRCIKIKASPTRKFI